MRRRSRNWAAAMGPWGSSFRDSIPKKADDPVGLKTERTQQQGMDHGEHGRGPADADREGQDGEAR